MTAGSLIKKLSGSMVGYLPIKILEGIIGILTLKVYTSLFIPEVYGDFMVVNSTISIAFLLCLGWIVQGIVRFSNTYATDVEKKKQFYSTMALAWFIIIGIIALFFWGCTVIAPGFLWSVPNQYTLLIIFVLVGYGVGQILLTHLLYSDKRFLNSILLLGSVSIKIVFTYLLTRVIGNTIMAIFISHSVTDFTIGIIAVFASSMHKSIRFSAFSRKMLKSLLVYGYPLMGLSLTMIVLNVSGRYVIEYFLGNKEVGLYTSNYTIAASIFTMIMFGLSRGIYPKILKAWNNNDHKEARQKLAMGGKYYLIIGLPSAIGLFLLASPIASICLGEKYFEGSKVIGFVAIGMFFCGLAEYYNRGWELKKNTFPILINCFIAALINIVLNIIFVPIVGYIFAAYSTAISYFIYLVISMIRGNKSMRFSLPKKSLANILLSCSIMTIIVLAFDYFFLINLLGMLIVIPIAAVAYFVCLYLTGEIKKEIKNLR